MAKGAGKTDKWVKLKPPCPVPSEVRDIDSIFGRLSRLSEAGRDFVFQQFFKTWTTARLSRQAEVGV